MYHGKHEKPATGIKKYKRAGLLLASLVLILAMTIGTTLAFIIDKTNPVQNTFNPSKVTIEIDENFDHYEKKEISFENSGDVPAYIRATVATYWTLNEDGKEIIVPAPIASVPELELRDDWFAVSGNDGKIFYYKYQVSAGKSTGDMAKPYTLNRIPEGYTFHMIVMGEAIQAEPDSVVTDAWKTVEVFKNDNGIKQLRAK